MNKQTKFIFTVALMALLAAGLIVQSLYLFRLNNATRWQVLWKLRLPNCVPSLCVGAKTSSGLAVVGSIVGEFFAGIRNSVSGWYFVVANFIATL